MSEEKANKKPKHGSYIQMILDAILHLPKQNTIAAEIQEYVKTNNKGLATATRFVKAINRALEKGIADKILQKKRSGKYRITSLGRLQNKKQKNKKIKNQPKQILPKKKHYETATGRTTCCGKEEHVISDDILFLMIDFMIDTIEQKKGEIDEWNNGLQQKFMELDTDDSGTLNKNDVVLVMIEYVGYDQSVALDEIENIMVECDKDNDGLVSFEEFLIATPKMHRYPIYKTIREEFTRAHNCPWLLHECPLPGLFRSAVREAFPDNHNSGNASSDNHNHS